MATLKRVDDQHEVPGHLPVIPLRDLVFFPYMVLPLLIGRPRSLKALEEAEQEDGLLLLVTQRDSHIEDPTEDEVSRLGTVVRVVQSTKLPDGTVRVVLEGLGRAQATRFDFGAERVSADVRLEPGTEAHGGAEDPKFEGVVEVVRQLYQEYVHLNPRIPDELSGTLTEVRDAVRAGHLMAGHLLVNVAEKQELLEATNPSTQFAVLREILIRELEILRIEDKLDQQIRMQIDRDRRQHYLQEQLRAIRKELGSEEGDGSEIHDRLHEKDLPPNVLDRAEKELRRLERLNPASPESGVIRGYLDWILALPWSERTQDNLEVSHASETLEEAHFGLDEVKDRILDYIAVLSLVGDLRGPILCLVGPPGVGKTSLGQSIARALGRSFVRMSLGGVRDEAEIRGHRRTYVGALPGRIIQSMRKAETLNPVFLLDEVDKLASDFHGDPSAALLEVLDPEQNRSFNDHYLEVGYDLSGVLFVATANTLAGIPEPLRDRMEVIRIPGYLDTEKRVIADRFLWPKQALRHGLDPEHIRLTDETTGKVIADYTREAGVRELERQISRIARKTARQLAERGPHMPLNLEIAPDQLKELLGPPTHLRTELETDIRRTGIANGLAWTSVGGEILDVEVAAVPGSGKIRLTGTLGEVMQESAFAALTYARSRAAVLGLDRQFHQEVDIHIHIPEGATPKDGPSAGITIAVALISALTEIPTLANVAMTGEITLRGRVLPVGGIKEKAVAAHRSGIERVLIPAANQPELELLPDEVREGLEFIPVSTMDEVLTTALMRQPGELDSGIPREILGGAAGPGVRLSQ